MVICLFMIIYYLYDIENIVQKIKYKKEVITMFEVVGSWLDWKKSQVSAALSNVAFDAHYHKLEKSIEKEAKKSEKEKVETKDDTKSSTPSENKTAVSETHDEKPKATKTESHKTDDTDNLKKDMKNAEEVLENLKSSLAGMSDDEEYDELLKSTGELLNKVVNLSKKPDPAEAESPQEDDVEDIEDETAPSEFTKLNMMSDSEIAQSIYKTIYENAGVLHKFIETPDMNLSKEESEKMTRDFNELFRPMLAKTLLDTDKVDLDEMEKVLSNRLGDGTLNGTIQTAFAAWEIAKMGRNPDDLPEGYKPLMSFAEEALNNGETAASVPPVEPVVESAPAASTTSSTNNTSTNKRGGNRRKK